MQSVLDRKTQLSQHFDSNTPYNVIVLHTIQHTIQHTYSTAYNTAYNVILYFRDYSLKVIPYIEVHSETVDSVNHISNIYVL